jgi:hypothetical protein
MKVICIKIPPTFVTIKLEIGKVYESYFRNNYIDNGEFSSRYAYITDELGNMIPCDTF